METNVMFRTCKKNYAELVERLEKIASDHESAPAEGYERSLMEIDGAVRELQLLVTQTDFTSVAEEVHFFKEIKPPFLAQFIYYAKVLEIEVSRPNAGQHILKEYYEYELRELRRFVEDYRDFYEYYRRKATYLDEKYFVRHQFDFKMTIDPNLYNYNPNFTTSQDYLVAQILANDRLERHLLQSIYRIEGYFFEKFSEKSPLTWSGSKSGLTELLYALHVMRCFNGGQVDFSESVKLVEKSFNINLGNFYKTLHEIKNRKTGRTKFLSGLAESLDQHFENAEV